MYVFFWFVCLFVGKKKGEREREREREREKERERERVCVCVCVRERERERERERDLLRLTSPECQKLIAVVGCPQRDIGFRPCEK